MIVRTIAEQPAPIVPRRIGWIRVVLPDGQHRWVPQKATDLNVSACEATPNCDLPLVSVRTLIPLAEYVRARLISAPWHSCDLSFTRFSSREGPKRSGRRAPEAFPGYEQNAGCASS